MDRPDCWKRRIAAFAAVILLVGCAQQEVSIPATATEAASTPTVTAAPSATAIPTETAAPTATSSRTITPTPTLDPDWGQVSVSCHPSTTGDTWGIYLTDSEFSFSERITLPGVNYHFPQFSPDGRYISYTRFCDEVNALVLYERDSGRQLLAFEEEGYFGYPYWSPDGSSLVFTRYLEGETVLYRFVVDGWYVERLLTWTGLITSFSWSPDGEHLALSAGDNTRMVLYRFDLVDRSLTQLSEDGEFAYSPSWSPTGEWVAYIDSEMNTYHVPYGELVLVDPFVSDHKVLVGLEYSYSKALWVDTGNFLIVSTINRGMVMVNEETLFVEDVIYGLGNYSPREINSEGNYLLFSSSGCCQKNLNILQLDEVMELEDDHEKWLVSQVSLWSDVFPTWAIEPDWAPEGDLIVFSGLYDPLTP